MSLRMIKWRILHPLNTFKGVFAIGSFNSGRKKKIFRSNPIKIGMKANSALAIALIVLMMISVFAWLSVGTPSKPIIVQPVVNDPTATPDLSQQTSSPTQTINPSKVNDVTSIFRNIISSVTDPITATKQPGLIESNPNLTATVWKTVATNAWQYFQPGNGVDRNTGLPKASLTFPYFTDWDLGVYIQAIIDANKTGLVGYDGDWGSNSRIEKVLTFLETRELNVTTNYPYWFYQASDGKDYNAPSDISSGAVDKVDTGRLFVALNNLKTFNLNLTSRIDNFVYNKIGNRSDYAALVPGIINSISIDATIYGYYYVNGFASFFPELADAPNRILNNILNSGNISTYNISLPKAAISNDPLLCSFFELNNNPKLTALVKQVYLAHEAKCNATGEYVAFSEGNTLSGSGFVYEWVVLPNGDTWKVINNGESSYSNMKPIIFTKVSMSFLAIYNTTFARNMAIYLEQNLSDSTSGYYAGADYNTPGYVNSILSIDNNSNGMILEAARYAIKNNS
jgi:hypothetical protein